MLTDKYQNQNHISHNQKRNGRKHLTRNFLHMAANCRKL